MDDDFCTITIDGSRGGEYYVACQYVPYLENGTLYNNGSNTITLYSSKNHDTYPRIQISSLSLPYYYSGSGYNGVLINDISRTDFNLRSQIFRFNNIYAEPVIFFCLIVLMFSRLFRGRSK